MNELPRAHRPAVAANWSGDAQLRRKPAPFARGREPDWLLKICRLARVFLTSGGIAAAKVGFALSARTQTARKKDGGPHREPQSHDLFTGSRQRSRPHTTTLTVGSHLFPPGAPRHLGM